MRSKNWKERDGRLRTSIAEYLKKENVHLQDTVYREESRDVLDFPIISGDFLRWGKRDGENEGFAAMCRYREHMKQKKEDTAYSYFLSAIDKLGEVLKQVERKNKEEEEHFYREIICMIRERKKVLGKMHRELEEQYEKESIRECFGQDSPLLENVIIYKDILYLTSFYQMSFLIKELKRIKNRDIKKTPFFVTSLLCFKGAMERGGELGIEGGPCLFGYDEVIVEVVHKSGEKFCYNFSEPKNYEMDGEVGDEELLAEHLRSHKADIMEITFWNKKQDITVAEYESIQYVFDFAKALNGKLIIPIPDMSYRKYLSSIFMELDRNITERAEAEFQQIVYEITDRYLMWIDYISKEYSTVRVEVLHERNESLCALFYQERAKYLERFSGQKKITSNEHKREAVIDYITMPALPFYRWGTQEIVQVDCISETDSYRKCAKIHKGAFRLHGFFYPERVSKDGVHTVFSAKSGWKDYK